MGEDRTSVLSDAWGIDLWRLWERRGLILGVTVVTLALGVVSLFIFDEIHEVQTRLFLTKGVDPTKGLQIETKEDRNFLGTQAEIISSPLIIRKALERAPVTLPPGSDDDLMKFVLESLTVSPVVNTNVLSIRFRGSDPDEALNFVDALIESYKKHLLADDTHRSSEVVELLTTREAQLRSELNALEEKYAEERRSSPLIGQAGDQIEANTATLAEISKSLAEARIHRVELDNKLQALTKHDQGKASVARAILFSEVLGDEATPVALGGQVNLTSATVPESASVELTGPQSVYASIGAKNLAEIEQQLRLAKLDKEFVSRKLGKAHETTREAVARVELLEQIRDEFIEATVSSLKLQLELEATRERNLEQLFEEERAKAKELDTYLSEEEMLSGEVARAERAYEAVYSQLTDIKLVDQALSSGRVSVAVCDLNGADRQVEKIWPAPLLLLPACCILGLAFGSVLVLVSDATKKSPIA